MEIKGTIEYTVVQDENGISLKYESTIENDIAAMAIAEYVSGEWINLIKEEKANHTGKVKAEINDRLNKTLQTKNGLKVLCNYAFALYEQFQKLEQKQEETPAEIKLENLNTDLQEN